MSDENTMEIPKDLREARDRAIAEAEEMRAQAAAAQAELRQFKAAVTFERAGLSGKHAELYLKANPDADVTMESIQEFANEYGLVASQDPAPAPEPAKTSPGLAAMGEAGGSIAGGAAPAAKPVMSLEEFQQLLVTNPQEAAKAYVEGTAPRNSLNVQANDLVRKGIIDH